MGELITEAFVYVALSASFALILLWGRPATIERRGRNAWVGIRIPSTMASESAWSAGHEAAWPTVKVACWVGLGSGPAAAATAVVGAGPGVAVSVWMIGVVAALVLLLLGARVADRAAKHVADRAPRAGRRATTSGTDRPGLAERADPRTAEEPSPTGQWRTTPRRRSSRPS